MAINVHDADSIHKVATGLAELINSPEGLKQVFEVIRGFTHKFPDECDEALGVLKRPDNVVKFPVRGIKK